MTTLGALAISKGIQTGPFGSQLHAHEYSASGVGVVMPQDIGENTLDFVNMARIPAEKAAELGRHRLQPGDIVYSRRGDVTRRSLVREIDPPMICGTGCLRVRLDDERVNALYVSYALGQSEVREWITRHAVGATMLNLNTAILAELPLSVPPKSEQDAVAEVLGALDDKIAANRRMMNAADDLVRANYAQLPSSENVVLGDIARSVRQQVGAADIAANAVYVGLEHFDRERLWLQRFGAGGDVTSAKNAFEAGDTLFGKLRPYFHKVGVAPEDGVCSTDVLVIRALEEGTSWLVAAASSSPAAIARAVQNSNGTRMPRAKWEDIAGLVVPDPGSREAATFEAWAEALGKRCFAAVAENGPLAKTRDELLPLLMSGRITVKDAEARVEGVV